MEDAKRNEEEFKQEKQKALNRLYRLSYFFSKETRKHEEENKKTEELIKKAEEDKAPVIIVACTSNAACMRGCLDATNEVIDYLRLKENAEYIEMWQLAGLNAMLDRCKTDKCIPYDLPYAAQATLGMWDELEKEFNK